MKGIPESTSRTASRQLTPNASSPNGFANAGDSLLMSNASRARFDVIIEYACWLNLSRPSSNWLFCSKPLKVPSRSFSRFCRFSTSATVSPFRSVMPRTL
jgi:hypothetical protein